MTIRQHEEHIILLKRDVQAAWRKACEADGIEPDASFVVFSNTPEAAAYNELMGMYQRAWKTYRAQILRNATRRAQTQAIADLGMRRVRGVLGGVYVE